MDNYGTCVKNQLVQAMIEASRLAKHALTISASHRQAIPFIFFIDEEQFSSTNLRGANPND